MQVTDRWEALPPTEECAAARQALIRAMQRIAASADEARALRFHIEHGSPFASAPLARPQPTIA